MNNRPSHSLSIALATVVFLYGTSLAPIRAGETTSTPAEQTTPDRAALETVFKNTLTEATLTGRWCLIEGDRLGPGREEKYTIRSVGKVAEDLWLINARIQYGEKDFVLPVPVTVKWAGDTPVILVQELGIPGGAKYSARVLVYGQTYAGTWSGGGHRGLLNGVITRETE